MEESQPQLELYVGDRRDTRIVGKIRDFLFSHASGINPSVIERRIQEVFPSCETPTHPPYALMIQKAIKVLNERNGSTEEAISGFIKNEFQDLPWAHLRILDLHLGKLCKAGELLRTARGRYMLMDDYNRLADMKETQWRGGRRRKKYKRRRNHRGRDTLGRSEGAERCNKLHECENEEQNDLSELHGTGTYEPTEKPGNSEISQLGVTEVGHGQMVQGQGQGEAEIRQNENTHERIQEAIIELKDKISSREIMNTQPHLVEKQNSMVIKLRIPCKKQPDNLRGDETLERSESAERCNELQERENEEQNRLSELHGTGANEMIEEKGKSEIGQRGVTEECPGRMVQGQGEAEIQQNENTNGREKQIEATTKISRFCSNEIRNNEKLSASLGSPTVAENQCENLPENLLAVVEHQLLTQQIKATTEMSRFCSDDINNNENLSCSLGSPTVSVIPKEKLQISEQEQHQNETPFVQQKFSGSCELPLDQEGPEFCMETTCSSLSTVPDLPVPISTENCPTFDAQDCLKVPNSTEFLEHTPSEGIELTPTQLLVQTLKCGTLEADLYAAFETLASMTFHEHKQTQDDISGSPKGRVEENTTFGDLEKHMPIPQCIEWQPIEKSFADDQEVSLLPPDGSIGDKQKPKYYKRNKQLLLRPQGRGTGRGRQRSLKLDRNPRKHKQKLQLQDQTLTSASSPNLEPNETVHSLPALNLPAAPNLEQLVDPTSEESPSCIKRGIPQLQLYLQMSWDRLVCRDLGTTSKMEDSLSSMNCPEHKPQQHGNKRGPKRKLNLDGKTEFGHLEQQPPKRRRRGRPPNPVPTRDHQWSWVAVEHRELQSSGSIERHCESWPQGVVAQVQVHSPNLADDNNPSWEQTQRRRPKLKLDANGSCRNQMVLPRRSGQVQGKRELLQLKPSNAYQSNQQLSPETCQSQGKRLLRSSLSKLR